MSVQNKTISKSTLCESFNDNMYNAAHASYTYWDGNYPSKPTNPENSTNWSPDPFTNLGPRNKVSMMDESFLSGISSTVTAADAISKIIEFANKYTCIRQVRFWHHYIGESIDTLYDTYVNAITNYSESLPSINLGITSNTQINEPSYSELLSAWRNVVNKGTYITFESTSWYDWSNHSQRVRR